MRNVLFTVALVVATFVSANAQFYLGGGLGFENNSELNPKSSLWIFPEVGYCINKKIDVGLEFGFAKEKQQNDLKSSLWSIAPYTRYSFYQLGRFEAIIKGSAGFTYVDGYMQVDRPYSKTADFRLKISPILAYNLTEKIVLFTQLNCLSLTFALINPEDSDYSHHFRFGASNSLINTSSLPIGFYYKF